MEAVLRVGWPPIRTVDMAEGYFAKGSEGADPLRSELSVAAIRRASRRRNSLFKLELPAEFRGPSPRGPRYAGVYRLWFCPRVKTTQDGRVSGFDALILRSQPPSVSASFWNRRDSLVQPAATVALVLTGSSEDGCCRVWRGTQAAQSVPRVHHTRQHLRRPVGASESP
jgi:hypothetical protein